MRWLWDAIGRLQQNPGSEHQRVVSELEVIRCRRQSDAAQIEQATRSGRALCEHARDTGARTPR